MGFNHTHYDQIRRHLAKYAPKTPPIIVAASKQQPSGAIEAAMRAGIRVFGENRVQEAADKWPALLSAHPDATLQMIGPLQSNKAEQACELFDEILTLDRPSLAKALHKAMAKLNKRPALMIQVNTGEEPQKGGIAPKEADDFIDYCNHELALPIIGLMCIPPADDYPAPHFALLASIAKRHGLKRLSMGMSGDYEAATRMGATEVRLGTVLFGQRD